MMMSGPSITLFVDRPANNLMGGREDHAHVNSVCVRRTQQLKTLQQGPAELILFIRSGSHTTSLRQKGCRVEIDDFEEGFPMLRR